MFGKRTTVDSVITQLTSIVADLEAVSLYNRGVALDKNAAANALVLEADEAADEAERANSIMAKFEDFLEL